MTTQLETVSGQMAQMPTWDVDRVRADFPILSTRANGKPLVYLDNAATTQKPRAVIGAERHYYESQNANIHRGVYLLSQTATALYEGVREKVRQFLNARETAEIIYTRGTTEGINLVAASWGRAHLKPGDEIVLTQLEHHSNIVPWQMICLTTGAKIRVVPINDNGELIFEAYEKLLASGRVKMVAVNHVSNSLGTINPVREIIARAHAAGALALIDGAQWVAHGPTDVQALDADFYAFSGHKLFGPTGIGVLYGKRALLDAMPPYQGGGDMIASVHFDKTEYAELPNKFEAGTPNIAGVAGLGAAIDYVAGLGLDKIGAYERWLLNYATARIADVPGLRIVGTAKHKSGVISFLIDGISTLDIGLKLDREGIAVRTGHHCCMPVMERFGIAATARASLAFYNTAGEIDVLVAALQKIATEAASKKPQAADRKPGDGAIAYPAATADGVTAAAAKLAEDFEFLADRDAKNEYVLELGAKLPHLFDMLKQVSPRVPGCMSQVYMVGRRKPETADVFEFVADADADIVRGLIAVLQRIYSGQKAGDVAAFKVEKFFERIGLEQFITSQRRNGLAGMVRRIREAAAAIHSDDHR